MTVCGSNRRRLSGFWRSRRLAAALRGLRFGFRTERGRRHAGRRRRGRAVGNAAGGAAGDRALGTVTGAAIGGMLGNRIGAAMDDEDKRRAYAAQVQALESGPSGAPVAWRNPDSGPLRLDRAGAGCTIRTA